MSFTPIETERLRLREWRESDLDPMWRMQSDLEWMRYMGGTPLTRPEAWRVIAVFMGHQTMRGYTHWALEEKDTGEFVGRVGPWLPEGWPQLEIGWGILRERWGRGYAVEAARAAAAWVHRELGVNEVCHLIQDENTKSARVAEKLGATRGEPFTMPFPGGAEVNIWRSSLPLLES